MPETITDTYEKKSGEGGPLKDEGIPPGVYRVDELGNFAPSVDWQPILQRIKWEELNKLIENWMRRGGIGAYHKSDRDVYSYWFDSFDCRIFGCKEDN